MKKTRATKTKATNLTTAKAANSTTITKIPTLADTAAALLSTINSDPNTVKIEDASELVNYAGLQKTYDLLTDGLENIQLSGLTYKACLTTSGYFVDLKVTVNQVVHNLTIKVPLKNEDGSYSQFTNILRREMGAKDGFQGRVVAEDYMAAFLEGEIHSIEVEGNCTR